MNALKGRWLELAGFVLAGFLVLSLVRQTSATAAERARAEEAESAAERHQVLSDAFRVRVNSLEALTAAQRAEVERIREESDRAIEGLRGRMQALSAELDVTADSIRSALPDSLRPLFAELEALHAAELRAAEEVIKQTERKFTAADALNATLTAENAGLKQALAVEQEQSRLWREAASKWEDAANQGFLEGLWRNLPGYVGTVGAGVILGLSLGG